MFKTPEILSPARSSGLRFRKGASYDFAASLTTVPLHAGELTAACKHYPIIFPMREPLIPRALLSLRKRRNDFVLSNGAWSVSYVPAHIRRYPFILGRTKKSGTYVLMVDKEAPHLQDEDGERLFSESGEPSEVVQQAKKFLTRFQQQLAATEKLLAPLAEADLLVERQLNIRRGETTSVVRGFRVVDMALLADLEGDTLKSWVRSGLLQAVYAHQHSLSNVKFLVKCRMSTVPEDKEKNN